MIARVLHISDLHFSSNLSERGRQLKRLRLLPGPNSHAFGKVDALSASVHASAETDGAIDLTLATGDVSTDGSMASLSTALSFLETKGGIYEGRPKRLRTEGLGAASAERLVIPGNHDRYGGAYRWPVNQQPSEELEKIFGISRPYPYAIGFRRSMASDSSSNPALLFFVFDSTLTDEEEKSNFLYRIARGRVESPHCRWLVKEAAAIRDRGWVEGFDGSRLNISFDRCIKIAVLHHHAVGKGMDVSLDIKGIREVIDLTKMENADEFIRVCFTAEIDFIFFGHQHLAYRGSITPDSLSRAKGWKPPANSHAVNYFCCPSTCEFKTYTEGDNRNGFYIYGFDERFYSVETFQWDDELRGFEMVNKVTLEYPQPPLQSSEAKTAGL